MYTASKQIKAVILDWSGTVCDKYAIAPAITFKQLFLQMGIPVTMSDCRKPMGLRKDEHIKSMLNENIDVYKAWVNRYNRSPTSVDVQVMYHDFKPLQLSCFRESNYTTLIPGVKDAINEMKDTVAIGCTTGFHRDIVDILVESAAFQGVDFDCTVAGDDVHSGTRPYPHMIYKNMDLLGIKDPKEVIKVDDTAGGIAEGLFAGCWTVGVSRYSSYMNIDSYMEEKSLSEEELQTRNIRAREKLCHAGAHLVIDSLAEMPDAIDTIKEWTQKGQTPHSIQFDFNNLF